MDKRADLYIKRQPGESNFRDDRENRITYLVNRSFPVQ